MVDLRSMDATTLSLLTDPDVLAVNQDWAGIQGHKLADTGDQEVWIKPTSAGPTTVPEIAPGRRSTVDFTMIAAAHVPNGVFALTADVRHAAGSLTGYGAVTVAIAPHAASEVKYYLGGACTRFTESAGVDDETGGLGAVTFTVLGDGATLARSGVVSGGQPTVAVDADVTGVTELVLVTGTGPDGDKNYDHSEWVDARMTCG